MVEESIASEKTAVTLAVGETPVALLAGAPPLTVGGAPSFTLTGAENSEVLPDASVAVAVIACPTATLLAGWKEKEALPDASVVTLFEPTKAFPSFSPEGLEKNSTVKLAPGVLFSMPL